MLPSSHAFPMNAMCGVAIPSPQLLADAFSEFISASSILEASYRDLQQEVTRLSSELSKRNSDLTKSLADNDRMRAELQQMLDSLPCGVLVLSSDQRIVMINPEGRNLLELGNAKVGNLRELSCVSKVNFELLSNGLNEEADNEVCIDSKTGKRWLAVGSRKLFCAPPNQRTADQEPRLKTIWILRDVTASKEAEQQREAARRNTVLAEISTILAHEIRNPLASLELFAGLIEKDREGSSEWISHLKAGIRTLSGTVNNVLSLNGEIKPHLVRILLAACVKNGVEFVQPIAEQAGIEISFSAADGMISVLGNEEAIRQIILNIVCNAIRHTSAGGTIHVSTRAAEIRGVACAIVEVADTGCGIPADLIEHIFDAGFSATGETPGLGLAVCKRLMTRHGGEIRVSSRINEGTVFQLEFPAI
jgi:nitrogen-specific signal transduction histidine kinase